MGDKPTEDDVLDKVKTSREARSPEDITMDAEREATIREQERLVREGSRLLDVLERNSTLPVGVSSVQVLGTRQTRASFLKSVTSPLLNDTPQPLSEVLRTTNTIANNLLLFNIFDPTKTHISFDRAQSPLSNENDVDITFHLREKPRFAAQTGTWAGDGEATAQMSARAENLFGGAERIEGVLEAGTRTRNAWEVKFQSPIAANPNVLGEVSVFGMARDYKFFASHELLQRGAHAKLKTLSRWGVHDITVSTILRQVTALSEKASPSIISSAGDTIKTSVSHALVHDKRDDTLLPSQGYLLKTMQEFAGLGGGDVKYLKATAETQFVKTFKSLWPRTHFIAGARGGVLWSLEQGQKTRITDRFHLGGPTDVRGFREFGIGPKDGGYYPHATYRGNTVGDSVGGEAYFAWSAGVLFPVPNAPVHWPIRLQAFVNAGSLLPLNQANVSGTFSELMRQPSVGVGVGMIYRTPIGRVELNFGVPVMMRQGDWARKGFQFGVGVDFM